MSKGREDGQAVCVRKKAFCNFIRLLAHVLAEYMAPLILCNKNVCLYSMYHSDGLLNIEILNLKDRNLEFIHVASLIRHILNRCASTGLH